MNNWDAKRAIFSDMTGEYVIPSEVNAGEVVKIRIRTLHGTVSNINLVAGDQTIAMSLGKGGNNKHGFDYYEAAYTMTESELSYYFMLSMDGENYVYDRRGLSMETDDRFAFRIIPGFVTPDWAKGGVFYQIYVDRFYNGDKSNDVISGEYKYIGELVSHKEWDEEIVTGLTEHYGGDLQGVIDKLDYLKDLGVKVIYLNPVFVSPSNHKYDTADYDYIDPHFGVIIEDEGELLTSNKQDNTAAGRFISRVTSKKNLEASNELFARLVSEAHQRDMKVILDGVFNHCGSFNKWMDAERIYEHAEGYEKGAYIAKDSPYGDFFSFEKGSLWPYNEKYDSWWGFNTLPKLNYESKELYDYILRVAAKWVSEPYNADGWRLDVAADLGPDSELNHRFWADFRKAVKEANPDAIILAEHYGDPSSWLDGKQWDTVMNYDAFMEPVTWFLTGMEKHSDEYIEDRMGDKDLFWRSMTECGAKFTYGSMFTAMNELSNHDHSRFMTRTTHAAGRVDKLGKAAAEENKDKAVMKQAVIMQMTWPGAPTLYYGDEAGLCGFTDPDNRRVYPWGQEDKDLLDFHKAAIGLHNERDELQTGSLIPLPSPKGTVAYARKKEGLVSIVVVNTMPVAMEYKLPVWMLGIGTSKRYKSRLISKREGFDIKQKTYKDEKGILKVVVEEGSAIVLCYGKKKREKAKKVDE